MKVHSENAQAHENIVAVCISQGGIPKRPVAIAEVATAGIVGDGHEHQKHIRPDRAISILDHEIMLDLVTEGFPLVPGATGENLTAKGLNVQRMRPGDILEVGDVILRLEQPRKPCYVLDAIDERLKDAIAERCGYMASVLRGGMIRPGMPIKHRHTELALGMLIAEL